MTRARVVIAGLGDSGLLTAIHLARHADVVGISSRPGLVSGKELGTRLTQPDEWARDHWIAFDRYRRLDGARKLKGKPLRAYRPRRGQWGSVVGVQPDGLEVFAPNGRAFRFPAWAIRGLLQGLIVRRGIYRGVRDS